MNDLHAALSAADPRPIHERLNISRRRLVSLLAMASTAAPLSALAGCGSNGEGGGDLDKWAEILQQIRERPLRRSLSSMSATDPTLAQLDQAIGLMKALPSDDPRSWLRQAQIHTEHCPHRNWYILPWHREYIFRFEQICQQLLGDSKFGLPYWDWTASPTPPDAFYRPQQYPNLFHASRAQRLFVSSLEPTTPAAIDVILRQSNFLHFGGWPTSSPEATRETTRQGLLEEGPHNYIHGYIGGEFGDMSFPAVSAKDPLFWMHHSRVEQLWVRWNLTNRNPNPGLSTWTDVVFEGFCNGKGEKVEVSIASMAFYPLLAYRYDTQ